MLLDVRDFSIKFATESGTLHAVNHVSLQLDAGESLGIVGESGCGKSTTAYALMRLLPANGMITSGEVKLLGEDIVQASDARVRNLRWSEIALVFQNSMSSLNPVRTIGDQIVDAMQLHMDVGRDEGLKRAGDCFERVGISRTRLMQYPHEFSGGMKQRAMLALSLICDPKLLIADEPTTALDVVAQRQVLELLKELQTSRDLALILISHDVSAVAEVCDMVAVMYAGQIVETGPMQDVFFNCRHPYTWVLISSFPALGMPLQELATIPGAAPALYSEPTGCSFFGRCPFAQPRCAQSMPPEVAVNDRHKVLCHRVGELNLPLAAGVIHDSAR